MQRAFFVESARKRTAETIARIESGTGAEVVVAVRRAAARYRDVDLGVGFVVSLVVLCLLLFLETPFALLHFPIDVTLGFLAGAWLSSVAGPLKRRLLRRTRIDQEVGRAARAAFHDLGISRTTGRTGVLVFVSLFERRLELLLDVGLPPARLGPEWQRVVADLERAVRARDFEAFLAGLGEMGPVLARACPRGLDDVNELPDTVDAA